MSRRGNESTSKRETITLELSLCEMQISPQKRRKGKIFLQNKK
jgi:hypothetical protein